MGEVQLHCFVAGSRRKIVESIGGLLGEAEPKFQQGGLMASRKNNFNEKRLFELLQAYADKYGDFHAGKNPDWSLVRSEFDTFRRFLTLQAFAYARPAGVLSIKASMSAVASALIGTALDPDSRPELPQGIWDWIDSFFSLVRGFWKTESAYILHIVGCPADVESDRFAEIFEDTREVLWDFGASHTEIGALSPAEHLAATTTNFLLGTAIVFQHFYREGIPAALIHKRWQVRTVWAEDRLVTHDCDALDMERAFRQADAAPPSPLSRSRLHDVAVLPKEIVVFHVEGPGCNSFDPFLTETWHSGGLSSEDLRRCHCPGIDLNLLFAMLQNEFMPPLGIPTHVKPYPPLTSTRWILHDWCGRTLTALRTALSIQVANVDDLEAKLAQIREGNHAHEARHGLDHLMTRAAQVRDVGFYEQRYKGPFWRHAGLFPVLYKLFLDHDVARSGLFTHASFLFESFYRSIDHFDHDLVLGGFEGDVQLPDHVMSVPEYLKWAFTFTDQDLDDVRMLLRGLIDGVWRSIDLRRADQALNRLASAALAESDRVACIIDDVTRETERVL